MGCRILLPLGAPDFLGWGAVWFSFRGWGLFDFAARFQKKSPGASLGFSLLAGVVGCQSLFVSLRPSGGRLPAVRGCAPASGTPVPASAGSCGRPR